MAGIAMGCGKVEQVIFIQIAVAMRGLSALKIFESVSSPTRPPPSRGCPAPRATRVLERSLNLSRTWRFDVRTPTAISATLGAAYALAGRSEDAFRLVAGAVEEFRRRQMHIRPAFIFLYAGITCLTGGRIDEATCHARQALALTRRLGARGSEAHTLCLTGGRRLDRQR